MNWTKLISKKWLVEVVAAYDHGDKKRGDVISRHKTYKAAEKAAKGEMLRIRYIEE